jgi:hypothetical protein
MMAMSDRMNKADLLEWIERWDLVNERQREEAARKTPAEKFLELGHLMAAADMFPMSRRKPADDQVRELWLRLHRRMTGRE